MSRGPADQLEQTVSSRRKSCSPSTPSGAPAFVVAYRHSDAAGAERGGGAGDRRRRSAVVRNATSTGSSACARRAPGLGEPAAIVARLADPDALDAARARGGDRQQAVGARADDEQRVARRAGARGPARAARSPAARRTCRRAGRASPSASSSGTSARLDADLLGEAAGIQRRRAELVAERLVAARGSAGTSPHGAWWWTTTRSPARDRGRRPRRSRSTSPTTSWPSTAGSFRAT